MKRSDYLLLYLISLLVIAGVSSFQSAPGYMDADYYLYTGERLVNGFGFTEQVIWNYLDDPQGLPHPSHSYWMPLPTLIAGLGIVLTRGLNMATFESGRIVFIGVAAAISPLTAALANAITQKRKIALFAGAVAIPSGFYLAYLPTTDSFALSMVLGALFFLITNRFHLSDAEPITGFAFGVICGLLSLNRNEGIIWFALAVYALAKVNVSRREFLFLAGGYALIFGPWLLRNLIVFAAPLAPGAGRSLWMTDYDQLFTYPASRLNFDSWMASGLAAMLKARLNALLVNLQTGLAVQGGILLAPLIIWGAWSYSSIKGVRLAVFGWLTLLFIMTIPFPFSGARGGFFHAAAALQPMLWVLGALGMHRLAEFGAEKRRWKTEETLAILGGGMVVILAGLSIFIAYERVLGDDFQEREWNQYAQHYEDLGRGLNTLELSKDTVVMVINPPGFTLSTGFAAISIPNGTPDLAVEVAQRYGATILLLEKDHPADFNSLYVEPKDLPQMNHLDTLDGTHIFQIFVP